MKYKSYKNKSGCTFLLNELNNSKSMQKQEDFQKFTEKNNFVNVGSTFTFKASVSDKGSRFRTNSVRLTGNNTQQRKSI